MSNGDYVRIDEDEIDKVADACQKRTFVFVRSGMINGAHAVGMHLDKDRVDEWHRMCGYGDETGEAARKRGIQPMENIFSGTRIGKIMDEVQRLRDQGKDATIGVVDHNPILVPKGMQLVDQATGKVIHDNTK